MPNPTPPDIDYSYAGFQQEQQDFPFPGTQLDNDLAELSTSIDETIDALEDIRRADGALNNGIVTADSLAPDLLIGLQTPTLWVTSTAYVKLDCVFIYETGIQGVYRCLVSHESADFSDDLAAGYWELIFSLSPAGLGLAEVAVTGDYDDLLNKPDIVHPIDFKASETPQSGAGSYTTYSRPPARVISEFVSIYDAIPEAERADIRTGLRSTSCTAFFEKMVNLMNPGGSNIPGGAKVIIPRGKYLIDGAGGIPLQDSIEWVGENKEGTRIQAMGNNPIFKSVGTSANQVGRAAVKNMTLVGDGKAHLSGYGIELVWMSNPLIKDVQFQALRWNIVQEYVVNAFIFGCSSNGTGGTIRGYLWKKAIDSLLFSGFDNTTTISDCYFMAGDLAMVLHGSNGIQMGGNVAMLQGGVRVGAIAETLADGSAFTPGADNDVIHFQHWDGLRLDTVANDRAIRVVKGAMAAPHDFRISSLWAGNVTGSNSYVCDFDGLEDFAITGGNIDVTGQTPFWFNNCKRGQVQGVAVRSYGGNNGQNAVLIQNSEAIGIVGNSFNVHASAAAADGVRAESSSRIRVVGNDFDFRSIAPTGSTARRAVLVDTTDSVVADNTANDRASYPCVESGTSNYNRVHDNPSSVVPTITGANSGGHDNKSGGYLTASTTYDPPSLVDGAGAQTNVTCSGAALGDFAVASFSLSISSITVTAQVTAANQVTVRFQNESGSTIDLASGTLAVRVFRQ